MSAASCDSSVTLRTNILRTNRTTLYTTCALSANTNSTLPGTTGLQCPGDRMDWGKWEAEALGGVVGREEGRREGGREGGREGRREGGREVE